MSPNETMGGGGVEGKKRPGRMKRLTSRWLKTAQEENRVEFEREMQRHGRRVGGELERFRRRHRHAS